MQGAAVLSRQIRWNGEDIARDNEILLIKFNKGLPKNFDTSLMLASPRVSV